MLSIMCQRDSALFGGFIVGRNDCESDGSSMVTCCGGAAICAYVLGMGRRARWVYLEVRVGIHRDHQQDLGNERQVELQVVDAKV